METIIIVKAVIINDDGEALVLRRSSTARYRPLDWDFPGGHVESGEDLADSVVREIKEETRLVVDRRDVNLFYAHTEIQSGVLNVVRIMFWTRLPAGDITLNFEHDEFHWTPLADVYKEFPHPVFGASVDYALQNDIFDKGVELIAKSLVFDEAGKLLLIRRSADDADNPGRQDIPGGGIEPGEDFAAAVSREIGEEAGLMASSKNVHLFYAHTDTVQGHTRIRLVFWTKIESPKVKLSFEHDAFKWIPAAAMGQEFAHHVYVTALEYGQKHKLFTE